MDGTKRIVILGGGFAGVTAACRLERHFGRRAEVQVTIVDAENFSLFTPLLPEVPSGSLQAKHIVYPLRAALRRTAVRQAEVRHIDLDGRVVVAAHCAKCHEAPLPYDHLVLAFGGATNFFGLPGLAEYARTMKSLADATALHAHLIDKLEHAELEDDPAARRGLLTFVVAGGGFAGVETAAQVNDFVRAAGQFYPRIDPTAVRVVLVHSGPRVLPEVSEKLSAYALGQLGRRGVEVRLGTRVKGATADRVALSTGEELACHTLVWAAGVAPHPLLAALDLPKGAGGRVEVDACLRSVGRPEVWALGDCAAVPDLAREGVCPPTAQHALRQGKVVADNVAAALAGGDPTPFKYKPLGLMAGLGRRSAVAEVMGLRFSGFFAWWLWRTVYLMKLPGFERKVRVALDWTLDLFFARDIVYLRSLHTTGGAAAVPVNVPDPHPAESASAPR
ncbi:MAG: NAD(P)/FAD-dependent oxidoreductase [Gemmataceae bacterium]|nr:NAD(P)/FAD-dependent oxidoreductase [Gemmataceae bacterium]